MIPVALAPEPADFDAKVRQPGLSAIDELVGRRPRRPRPGPRRSQVATSESKIPAEAFPPYWREALDDMVERRAPFIAAELRRQGQLVRGDV